jgi:hypothetical protein
LAKGPIRGCQRFYWARKITGAVWGTPVRAHFRFRPSNRYRGRYRGAAEDALKDQLTLSYIFSKSTLNKKPSIFFYEVYEWFREE